MLVDAILEDSARAKPGPTIFTTYLTCLNAIILAACLGAALETSGELTFTVTNVCNGLGQCTPPADVPVWAGPGSGPLPRSWNMFFPCQDLKDVHTALLPLSIVSFLLAVLLFPFHVAAVDHWGTGRGVFVNVVTFLELCLLCAEDALVLYAHLGEICVYPGQEARGKLAIRHALRDMELGPLFALLGTATFVQLIIVLWTNRRCLRGVCDLFNDCGDTKKKIERARQADKVRQVQMSSAHVALAGTIGDIQRRRRQNDDAHSNQNDGDQLTGYTAPPTAVIHGAGMDSGSNAGGGYPTAPVVNPFGPTSAPAAAAPTYPTIATTGYPGFTPSSPAAPVNPFDMSRGSRGLASSSNNNNAYPLLGPPQSVSLSLLSGTAAAPAVIAPSSGHTLTYEISEEQEDVGGGYPLPPSSRSAAAHRGTSPPKPLALMRQQKAERDNKYPTAPGMEDL
jgi:hypothetical protein